MFQVPYLGSDFFGKPLVQGHTCCICGKGLVGTYQWALLHGYGAWIVSREENRRLHPDGFMGWYPVGACCGELPGLAAYLSEAPDRPPVELVYVEGDATRPLGIGPRVIMHLCNSIGGWGRGFVMAISARWSSPERLYRLWHRHGYFEDTPWPESFALGAVQFVPVADQLWVANIIGQEGVATSRSTVPPIRYPAVQRGLERVADFARVHGATVHAPRLGAGLAGGKWEEIERIILQSMPGIHVSIYDMPTA